MSDGLVRASLTREEVQGKNTLDGVTRPDYFDSTSITSRRSLMRTAFLCLAALLVVSSADATPAPAPSLKAKEKLEALKKVLPSLLEKWVREPLNVNWLGKDWTIKPELRLLRRLGPNQAKAIIIFAATNGDGERDRDFDVVLTVFLFYQDDCWTTGQFEAYTRLKSTEEYRFRETFSFLILAIDEAAEKRGTK
jgi:hypothetical protein